MDSEVKLHRSLPPLVQGKVHGTLKLVIDEVLWIRKGPGDVTVKASWWGEHDSAQFRPIDSNTNEARTNEDTTQIYAVKTNAILFEDYIKNCEIVELVIIIERTHEIIGTAYIGELFKIFICKPYSQYVPILNITGNKIGEIHISLHLMYLTKSPNMQLKANKYSKKQVDDDILLSTVDNLQHDRKILTSYKNDNIKKKNFMKSEKNDTLDTYKSVLKDKRPEFQESQRKLDVTDKLVAQIVARTQQLRGAILKETCNEDLYALSDSSTSSGLHPYVSASNEAKLYEYILGKEMNPLEERKALDTLRSTSPTPSLIDLASEMITANKHNNIDARVNSPIKSNNTVEEAIYKEATYNKPKGTDPLDYVDSIRIFIESFALSSAGYRRAKSTCLQRGVPLSLTYFVQYDTFGFTRQIDKKCNRETKLIRTCAKKQIGQVIDFNSESIYAISRHILNKDFLLKFKIFVRHLNQKSPIELGCGSININDAANSTNLSSTQRITIVKKGIKIGELNVTVELGCDLIHFGKEFIDAVISAKENIPLLEIKSPVNISGNKYKKATGTHSSKSNSKVSTVSARRIECLTNNNNKDLITAKDITEHRERNLDNKKVDTSNPETDTKDKVLLHGLIYIAEGKNLPESDTYLICRAFWREDKATSQICSNTKNPFYHFCQLVPLIHGIELLERIKDNYIIIEVYSRQNSGMDHLLGIAKLPVHQLYVAYRDPLVLPHLLLSKYPIISVDGWVNINDPVNGKFCGELLALVALGTAEQIALLEISRGLKNTIMSQAANNHQCISDNINCVMSKENLRCNVPDVSKSTGRTTRDNNFVYHIHNTSDRDLAFVNYRTQEIQTDISVLKDGRIIETPFTEDVVLHGLVDNMANACAPHTNKISTDQSAQTEMIQMDEEKIDREELCLNTLNSNTLSDDNDSYSPRNNFQLPTEMFRSVGVGAEYDEEPNQQQNIVYNNSNSSIIEENLEKDEPNINCDNSFFRAVVEIECALHLPKIGRPSELVEPSTYVTFQKTLKPDLLGKLNSYMITTVCLHSCNPKWNWKCDAKLPTELLLNDEKRLILKVWHLVNPDATTIVNLEKDTVIGFAAVDLSILMAGFPTVSGWFHIMDFIGRCNGQIKISITPLDSLPLFGRFVSSNASLSKCNNLQHIKWPYSYSASYSNTELKYAQQMSSHMNNDKDRYTQDDINKDESCAGDAGHTWDSVSMSILSSSLKQKLDELHEITKSLQSRLRDVTNTVFEDEFDSDFDVNESNSENEYTDNRNIEIALPVTIVRSPEQTLIHQEETQNKNISEKQSSVTSSSYNPYFESISNQNETTNPGATDTGYCSNSTIYLSHPRRYQLREPCSSTHNYLSESTAEYPAQGTKAHINHLLNKLSLDFPPKSLVKTDIPMKRDIIDLFAQLRERRNNLQQDKNSRIRSIDSCSVPTQTTSNTDEQHIYSHTVHHGTSDTSEVYTGESIPKSTEESQTHNKISTVIREELVAEENEDVDWDDLTTYLLTTNVRYRNLDDVINPLFYQHLVPDLQVASTISPEGEAVEQLDHRYARNFSTTMGGSRIDRLPMNNSLSAIDMQTKGQENILISAENTELLRLPLGMLKNVNDNNDITVIQKSNNNDLMSDNNTESITTASFEKSIQQADIEIENYCFDESNSIVPEVSRQAPDGGNPVEDVKISIVTKQQDDEARNISAVS